MDGSIKQGGSHAGCGAVFKDSTGAWIVGFVRKLYPSSVRFAELWRIFTAFQIAWDRQLS